MSSSTCSSLGEKKEGGCSEVSEESSHKKLTQENITCALSNNSSQIKRNNKYRMNLFLIKYTKISCALCTTFNDNKLFMIISSTK